MCQTRQVLQVPLCDQFRRAAARERATDEHANASERAPIPTMPQQPAPPRALAPIKSQPRFMTDSYLSALSAYADATPLSRAEELARPRRVVQARHRARLMAPQHLPPVRAPRTPDPRLFTSTTSVIMRALPESSSSGSLTMGRPRTLSSSISTTSVLQQRQRAHYHGRALMITGGTPLEASTQRSLNRLQARLLESPRIDGFYTS